MSTDLGGFLDRLRRKAGVSRTEGARRSGVSRMTLYRWESGKCVPHEYELSAVLDAYAADTQHRNAAFGLRERERVERTVRNAFIRSDTPTNRGDLLFALRVRAGKTQEDVASLVGVSRSAVRDWERFEEWPDDAILHRLAFALDADENECAALTAAPAPQPAYDDSLDAFAARLQRVIACSGVEECETEVLTLMARLAALTPAVPAAAYPLWALEYAYAALLSASLRQREAENWLRRAESRALPVRNFHDAAWPTHVACVVQRRSLRGGDKGKRARLARHLFERQRSLADWETDFPPDWRAAREMEMALTLHHLGDDESALSLARNAFAEVADREDAAPDLRLPTYGALLCGMGRFDVIRDVFPRYLGRRKDAAILYYLGLAARDAGESSSADEHLGGALIAAQEIGHRHLERDIQKAHTAARI